MFEREYIQGVANVHMEYVDAMKLRYSVIILENASFYHYEGF